MLYNRLCTRISDWVLGETMKSSKDNNVVLCRLSLLVGVCVLAQFSLAGADVPKRSITWTKDHTTLANHNVYGSSSFGAANNSETTALITVSPAINLSVLAHYDVTGSTATPSWTSKFDSLQTFTYSYVLPVTSFYLGAHKQVAIRIVYVAEQGDEKWNGVEVFGNVTTYPTATRNRDYYVSGAELEITLSDTPGGAG